jgi:hypothetical protein
VSPAAPIAPSPFDLATLRTSLPAPSSDSSKTFTSSSFPDQAPTSLWATDFLTHTSKLSVVKSLQSTTPQKYQGYPAREQMHQPSFSHGASRPVATVTVISRLRLAALRPQLPMHRMPQMSTFAHLPQTTLNLHTGSQIDSMPHVHWPTIPL